MITTREARIAMDYMTGKTVAAIAEAEDMSTQRVYQLLNKVAYRVLGFSSIQTAKMNAAQFQRSLHHLMHPARRQATSDTPEGFFYEMCYEEKIRDY